ncbi:hypothetical protein J3A83DRAFT_4185535 [Scleroderma citrinum]
MGSNKVRTHFSSVGKLLVTVCTSGDQRFARNDKHNPTPRVNVPPVVIIFGYNTRDHPSRPDTPQAEIRRSGVGGDSWAVAPSPLDSNAIKIEECSTYACRGCGAIRSVEDDVSGTADPTGQGKGFDVAFHWSFCLSTCRGMFNGLSELKFVDLQILVPPSPKLRGQISPILKHSIRARISYLNKYCEEMIRISWCTAPMFSQWSNLIHHSFNVNISYIGHSNDPFRFRGWECLQTDCKVPSMIKPPVPVVSRDVNLKESVRQILDTINNFRWQRPALHQSTSSCWQKWLSDVLWNVRYRLVFVVLVGRGSFDRAISTKMVLEPKFAPGRATETWILISLDPSYRHDQKKRTNSGRMLDPSVTKAVTYCSKWQVPSSVLLWTRLHICPDRLAHPPKKVPCQWYMILQLGELQVWGAGVVIVWGRAALLAPVFISLTKRMTMPPTIGIRRAFCCGSFIPKVAVIGARAPRWRMELMAGSDTPFWIGNKQSAYRTSMFLSSTD